MRLNRLDLIRYGRFQDFTLNFGERPQAGSDVTVVYGANEAGKSTAFMAWLDFLFGFQGASPYAFRFERRDLLVGSVLETPDGIHTLRRSTASAGSLTDANGHTVAEQRMAGWLFGLDREAYRTRFSLNDVILRIGGQEIAQAQGDLGQLLHAGASGLSGLSNALMAIESEVAAFHRKGGRKTVANEARNRLKELEAELRTVRLDPRSFDRLSRACDDAEAAFRRADEALAAARRALKLREAADQRREIAREIETLRAELATFPTGPDLPARAVARVAGAAQKCGSADETAAKAKAEAAAAAQRLAAIDGDPLGQQVAAHLAAVEAAVFGDGESLLPRVQTAHVDLSKRRGERNEITVTMAELARKLAGSDVDPSEIVLPKALLDSLRRAADGVRTARAALDGEIRARRKAEVDQGEPVEPPEGLEVLEDAVQAWHRDPDSCADALLAARSADEALADLTAGLPPSWPAPDRMCWALIAVRLGMKYSPEREQVAFVDFSSCQPQAHRGRLLCLRSSHPVVDEAVDLDDLHKRLRAVVVIPVPSPSRGARASARGRAQVAPNLVEVGVYAPQRPKAQQPGNAVRIVAVPGREDRNGFVGLGLAVVGPGISVAANEVRDGPTRSANIVGDRSVDLLVELVGFHRVEFGGRDADCVAEVLAPNGHGLVSLVVAHSLVEGNRDHIGGRGSDPIRECGNEGDRQPRIGIAHEDQPSLHAPQYAAEKEGVRRLKDVLADETPDMRKLVARSWGRRWEWQSLIQDGIEVGLELRGAPDASESAVRPGMCEVARGDHCRFDGPRIGSQIELERRGDDEAAPSVRRAEMLDGDDRPGLLVRPVQRERLHIRRETGAPRLPIDALQHTLATRHEVAHLTVDEVDLAVDIARCKPGDLRDLREGHSAHQQAQHEAVVRRALLSSQRRANGKCLPADGAPKTRRAVARRAVPVVASARSFHAPSVLGAASIRAGFCGRSRSSEPPQASVVLRHRSVVAQHCFLAAYSANEITGLPVGHIDLADRVIAAGVRAGADYRDHAEGRARSIAAEVLVETKVSKRQVVRLGHRRFLRDHIHRLSPRSLPQGIAAQGRLADLRRSEASQPTQTVRGWPSWRAAAEAGVPEVAEIEAVAERLQQAESWRDAQAGLVREAAKEWDAARCARDALAENAGVVLDEHVTEARRRRDQAWIAHLAALDKETAVTFARAMHDDDVVRERHAVTAESRLRFARACEDATTRHALHEKKAAMFAEAKREVAAAGEAAAAMAKRLGLPPSAPVKALRQRRDRLAEALQAARRVESARAAAEGLQEMRAARLRALREALGRDGALLPDTRIPTAAQRALDALRARKAAADGWREARRTIEGMRASEALAAQALADLEAALAARLDGLWCADLDAGRLLDSLSDLEKLAELNDRRLQLDRRIDAMERALAAFEPMAAPLRSLLGLNDSAIPSDVLAAARRRAAEAAEKARAVAAEKELLARAERVLREAAVERSSAQAEIAQLLEGQRVEVGDDAVEAIDRLSRRHDIRRRLGEAEAACAAAGRNFDSIALTAEEAERDPVRTDALREAVEEAVNLRDEALAGC